MSRGGVEEVPLTQQAEWAEITDLTLMANESTEESEAKKGFFFRSNQEEDLLTPPTRANLQSCHGHQLTEVICLEMQSRCHAELQLKNANWRKQLQSIHIMVKTNRNTVK